jgi:hypothetical protein
VVATGAGTVSCSVSTLGFEGPKIGEETDGMVGKTVSAGGISGKRGSGSGSGSGTIGTTRFWCLACTC